MSQRQRDKDIWANKQASECVCCDSQKERGKDIVDSEGGWWKDFVKWEHWCEGKGVDTDNSRQLNEWVQQCVCVLAAIVCVSYL